MDQNTFIGVGRLARDPEFIPAGRKGDPHARFTLVINRVVAGENGPQADYLTCTLWGEEAIRFCETRAKGDEVGIKARVRTSLVQKAGGGKDFFIEFRVEEVTYGRKSLKNLSPRPEETPTTQAVSKLAGEF